MDASTEELLALLDLRPGGAQGVFTGPSSPDSRIRVFGGQLLSQALAAACFTLEGPVCHSLHAYFLRPGKPGRPTDYEVAAMRDGQSFTQRKVVAVQRDEVTLELTASFSDEPEAAAQWPEHQPAMPEVPAPETFPDEQTRIAAALEKATPEMREWISRPRPIEAIRVGERALLDAPPSVAPVHTWMRVRGRLVDDPNLHRCALAYASDMGALEPSLRAIGGGFGDSKLQVASLDHAMWFHRPFRFDEWLLFAFETMSVGRGRGLTVGRVWSREGRMVASIAQEGLMRPR